MLQLWEYVSDSKEYFYCNCHKLFCSNECGVMKYKDMEKTIKGKTCIKTIETCKYCRLESATNNDLFDALLKHYRISREDAFDIWKKQQ
jgi:hypothetical protein